MRLTPERDASVLSGKKTPTLNQPPVRVRMRQTSPRAHAVAVSDHRTRPPFDTWGFFEASQTLSSPLFLTGFFPASQDP